MDDVCTMIEKQFFKIVMAKKSVRDRTGNFKNEENTAPAVPSSKKSVSPGQANKGNIQSNKMKSVVNPVNEGISSRLKSPFRRTPAANGKTEDDFSHGPLKKSKTGNIMP
jgi:hypothetical protein